ncbi:early transcription factor 82 kDa subunit [Striga asiatica]|uniref:Early transcription factor 82 kDa subunit n=1 Tax=Striga asiatica TaxID=4170 RepID=A0A5A7Q9E4_STRAF|nr:early transcription factor 82 kDa subunit [Striga asiatica]
MEILIDYEPEPAGYSMKLIRSEFRSSGQPRRITMLPQLDINFRFVCRFNHRRRPSLRISVRRNLLQVSSYHQTREALEQVLQKLLAPADNEEVREMAGYAARRALEVAKGRPEGRDVLDMFFTVSEQNYR